MSWSILDLIEHHFVVSKEMKTCFGNLQQGALRRIQLRIGNILKNFFKINGIGQYRGEASRPCKQRFARTRHIYNSRCRIIGAYKKEKNK